MSSNCFRIIFFCFILITYTDSNHFLGGTITWSIQNVATDGLLVAIRITQMYSWTYVAGRCDGSAIVNNQPVLSAAGVLTCSPNCPSGFGTVSAVPYCTDVSPSNGIAIGQRLDTVVIPTGSNFFAIYAGSAWNSQIFGASSWLITSHINLIRRSDNNLFNNAPVATVMSPMNIRVNQTTVIPVSVSDADGDFTRCRWAISNTSNGVNECGSVCPPNSLPPNTILYSNCTIQITAPTIGSIYALAFIVEDFISSSSNISLSTVPVQFIIKIVASPSCSNKPEVRLDGPSCITIKVNETFTSQLLAINHCGSNVTIFDIATSSFTGMHQSSITQLNSSIYYKNLTWTPTISQLGYQIMCAMAVNSENTQSSQYCFTFYVTINRTDTCPGVKSTSSSITTTTTRAKSTTINWPLIGSFSGLILSLAIIYSICTSCYLYKHFTNRRRLKLCNEKSVNNNLFLSTTREQSQIDSSTTLFETIKKKPVNKSMISPIVSNNKSVKEIDRKQVFQPKIMYSRSHIIQTPFNNLKSYKISSEIENETICVRTVSLPVEKSITNNDLSQIETIDLPLVSAKPTQIIKNNVRSTLLTNTVSTESKNVMENIVPTTNISYIYEIPVDKSRKTKLKRKKLSGIHVKIKSSSKSKY